MLGGVLPVALGPEVVAETMFRTATDGTAQLRYPAGPSAGLIAQRAATDDATFIGGIRTQLGI